MRALDQLVELKAQFGREAEKQAATLLANFRNARVRRPADLIRLHETVLFLRAYPHSPRVLRLADELLFSFGERLRNADQAPFEDPEVSGMAGTAVSTNYSYEVARSLIARHGRSMEIDWENYDRADRLAPILARLAPLSREDSAVEPHVDWRKWFVSARGSIRWLLENVEPRMYDLLEVPLRWNLGDSPATRSRTRIPTREIFYQRQQLLKRRDVSLEGEFSTPRIDVSRLPRPRAESILAVIVETSAVRYRELHGFTHPDLAHVYHAHLGRGVETYFFGVPPEWRLPLRAYHCGMFFKNGVPIGYVEGLSLFERMEVGFNLYYTFREGETAWLYARVLKLFREQLGVTCYAIDPYQLGHENEEAIESGAFWFYRKLGFRSTSEEAERLAAREEARIAAAPGYRSSAATLRRLAQAPLIYGGGHEWDRFEVHNIRKLPWKSGEILRAKQAPQETRYLRLLQNEKKLRAAVLRLGANVIA